MDEKKNGVPYASKKLADTEKTIENDSELPPGRFDSESEEIQRKRFSKCARSVASLKEETETKIDIHPRLSQLRSNKRIAQQWIRRKTSNRRTSDMSSIVEHKTLRRTLIHWWT